MFVLVANTPKASADDLAANTPKASANVLAANTPKALTNFSPMVGACDNLGLSHLHFQSTLKGFTNAANPFRVDSFFFIQPQGSRKARTLG